MKGVAAKPVIARVQHGFLRLLEGKGVRKPVRKHVAAA
jgi:hypothetical protein